MSGETSVSGNLYAIEVFGATNEMEISPIVYEVSVEEVSGDFESQTIIYEVAPEDISYDIEVNIVSYDVSISNSTIISSVSGVEETFETVSKNLAACDATLSYSGDFLSSITYTKSGGEQIVKTLSYNGDVLSSVILSGDTPDGITLTKSLDYTSGLLTSMQYN